MTEAFYRERTIIRKTWRRTHRVEINNPYLGQPTIRFDEEDIEDTGGVLRSTPAEGVFCDFDPKALIPLVDPDTLEPTGDTISMAGCYLAILSLYMSLAGARDATTPPPADSPANPIESRT